MMGDFSDRVGLDWITLDAKITSGVGGSRQHSKEGWCPYNLLPWGEYWLVLQIKSNLANKFCRLCRLTIVPQSGRSGLKKADAFPVLLIGNQSILHVLSHHFPNLKPCKSTPFQLTNPQESDGDPWSGPSERALQPFPRHQRELYRSPQVRILGRLWHQFLTFQGRVIVGDSSRGGTRGLLWELQLPNSLGIQVNLLFTQY